VAIFRKSGHLAKNTGKTTKNEVLVSWRLLLVYGGAFAGDKWQRTRGLGTTPTSKFLRCQWYVGHPSAGGDPSHFCVGVSIKRGATKWRPRPNGCHKGSIRPANSQVPAYIRFFLFVLQEKAVLFTLPEAL